MKTLNYIALLGLTSTAISSGATIVSTIGADATTEEGSWTANTTPTSTTGETNTAVYSIMGKTVVEGGETVNFDYTLTVVGTGLVNGQSWPSIFGSGVLSAGGTSGAGARFYNGDTLTFTISAISDDSALYDINFDGFTGYVMGNYATPETFLVNGFNLGSSGTTTLDNVANGMILETAGAAATGVTFRSLSYEFSTVSVPEPSSTALLGLGGLALILRRRK